MPYRVIEYNANNAQIEEERLGMAAKSVLVVDDEEDILELLEYNLAKEGYRVLRVTSGEKALEASRSHQPDLILLDLMLPGLNGLEVCKRLKGNQKTSGIPIVMLTAKGEEADVVLGLELGADDYITKPFSPRVLAARLRAVFRRQQQASAGRLSAAGTGSGRPAGVRRSGRARQDP